jgi:hypothetical protein
LVTQPVTEPSGNERRWRLLWIPSGLAVIAVGFATWYLIGARDPTPVEAFAPPRFVEQAAASGIEHVYDGEYEFYVGGGVAVFDCDGDRKPDLYFAGGINPAALYRNESPVAGDFRFARLTSDTTDVVNVTGAYPIDIDSDGTLDLAVLRYDENLLLRGLGDCRFEIANEIWGFDGGNEWTTGFSARWDEGAAFPTVAFANYVDEAATGTGYAVCSDNVLIRPDGSGFGSPEALSPGWCSLSLLFSDWGRSGKTDLRVTNDKHYYNRTEGEEQLWRIPASGTPTLYQRDEGWVKVQIWGMGIASHDTTGDGLPEIFLTSQGDNKLQTLAEGPVQPEYENIAIRRGVTAHRPFDGSSVFPSTGWHPEFDDVNNDGLIDLYISKGNVEAQSDHAADDPNNLLIGQPDGTFVESADTSGIINKLRSRGAALVDLNLDGLLDLVEVNRRETVTLWRNIGVEESTGNWVAILLVQPGPNTQAIGSWIEVEVGDTTITRETTVGGGHASGQAGWIHVGVGHAMDVEIRVQWPDGESGPQMTVAANQFVVIERDAPTPSIWTPPGGAQKASP